MTWAISENETPALVSVPSSEMSQAVCSVRMCGTYTKNLGGGLLQLKLSHLGTLYDIGLKQTQASQANMNLKTLTLDFSHVSIFNHHSLNPKVSLEIIYAIFHEFCK